MEIFKALTFKYPLVLLLIPIIALILFRKKFKSAIQVPGVQEIKKYTKRSKKHRIGNFFMFLAISFMVLALARPQKINESKSVKKDGIDIAVALDLSKSMEATDFKPNRLEKSKELLADFFDKRSDDRISLVVFGGDSYTKVPLTFDYNALKSVIKDITTDDITSNNRTAIGMGLGVAINRLKESEAKSKVVILMTDGENNSGEMSPQGAAEIAKDLGIKVYTIGIGAKEIVVNTFLGRSVQKNRELDENLLIEIADKTDGKYFRASNEAEFQQIFEEINNLEKTEIENNSFYDVEEFFTVFLKIAMLFLLISLFFECLLYIRVP